MLFTQGRFLVFFLVVFALHWGLRSARARKLWLLVASYAFYAGWDWRCLSLLWLSTAVDYACARAMEGRERAQRRPWVVASVVANLGLLATFKYFAFFVDSAAVLLAWLGLETSRTTLAIVLPVGISFYTFQTMSYSIDVYRGRLAPVRDVLDFALYVGFFPQIGAGPITRAVHFLPQLATPRRFEEHVDARAALTLFLLGFLKKACLADGIGAFVDPVFEAPGSASAASAWLALLLYHAQIYCDFSGYTDMAIAAAWLLGYRLPENFAFPYFARGIGEFWRRWHISLSAWMRDYLFLPLAGKRPSAGRWRMAMLVTMSLCGLWHGAGWQFAGFGFLHGAYLVLEELGTKGAARARGPLRAFLACLALNLVVLLTWPVFRMESFGAARALYGGLFGLGGGSERLIGPGAIALFLGCALAHWLAYRRPPLAAVARLPGWGFAALYGFAWSQVLPWVAVDLAPFIYFQF